MIRISATRLATIAMAVALIPLLAGCYAGLNAQTNLPFDPTDGASTVFHNIAIRNVFVLGPTVDGSLLPGQTAGMFLALVNDGSPDRLVAISAPGTATSVTIRGGRVKLVPGQSALLTGPAPQIVLSGLTRSLSGGQSIPLTLTFQRAGTVAMIVPVVPRVSSYATFLPPAPSKSPQATPTATHTKRAAKIPRLSPTTR